MTPHAIVTALLLAVVGISCAPSPLQTPDRFCDNLSREAAAQQPTAVFGRVGAKPPVGPLRWSPSDGGVWRQFANLAALQSAVTARQISDTATYWTKDDHSAVVVFRFVNPKNWVDEVTYCYRSPEHLVRIASVLETHLVGDAVADGVRRVRHFHVDASGKVSDTIKEIRNLKSGVLAADRRFLDIGKEEVFLRTADLPFSAVLAPRRAN